MADEHLVLGLAAWLRDSDVPPPEARMSATRVMAGVEVTARLGRLWPPARFAPTVEPAAALGAFGLAGPPPRPVPRAQKPRLKTRLRQKFTSVRVLAVATVLTLMLGIVFIAASMLPSGSPSQSAVVLAPASHDPGPAPALVLVATPVPEPTTEPTPIAAPTWAPSELALDWHTDSTRMEADAVSLVIGDKTFSPPDEARASGQSGPDTASLQAGWFEAGVEQRLVVEIVSDGREWWVDRIRSFDGRKSGGWLDFEGLADRTTTPVGESWEGDLRVKSTGAERKAFRQRGSAVLDFKDLRLSAFGPQGQPATD